MKKFLSITLAISILLSVFCMIPAQANVSEFYPYLSLDFEENNVADLQAANIVGKRLSPTWKAGGANGTGGCLNVTDNADYSWEDFFLAQPLVVGQKYRVSAWVRLNDHDPVELGYEKNIGVRYLLYSKTFEGKQAVKQVLVTPTEMRAGQWVLCETTFLWDGKVQDETDNYKPKDVDANAAMSLGVRFDSGVGDGTTYRMKLDGKPSIKYDMDDIILEPVIEKDSGPKYDDSYTLTADFENDTIPVGLEGLKNVTVDAERGKVGYAKFPIGSFATVTAHGKMKVNHTYKISTWIKRLDNYCVFGGDTTRVDLIGNPVDRVDYTNLAPTTKYPTSSASQRINQQNKWFYYEWYVKYEAKSFDSWHPDAGLRIGNSKASLDAGKSGEIGLEGVEFLVDDFLIQDLGLVANGDMEHATGPIFLIGSEPKASSVTDSVFAWRTSNATASTSTDVPAGTGSTKSMQVKIGSNGGKVYQGVNLENNASYKVSFWAKGNKLADDETKTMKIAFDRSVNTVMAQDVYNVPDYETIGEFTLTNEWQQYEYEFDYSYDANSAPASGNVIPRMPFLYVEVDGNKSGTEFMLDNFTLVDSNYVAPDTRFPYPYLENVSADSADGIVETADVEVYYDFISEYDKMEGESIVRMIASDNGTDWGIVKQVVADYGLATINIPSSVVGKQVKLEIIPVDLSDDGTKSQMGIISTIDLGVVDVATKIVPEITKWDAANGEVAAKVYMEQNLRSAGNQDVVVILAVYDENNTLIGTSVKPQTVVVGEPSEIVVSASIKGIEDLNGTNAKLFVWSGTSLDDAGEKIYANAISYSAE